MRLAPVADLSSRTSVAAHDGAILDIAADPAGDGFITGGDDGAVRRIAADGTVTDLGSFGAMKWVEHVATYALDKGRGLIAASSGKLVKLFDEAGKELEILYPPRRR